MRIVSSNIKHTMRQFKREHDIAQVSQLGNVIMWQEIEVPTSKQAVAGLRGRHTFCLDRETPITLNSRGWQVEGAGESRLMHHGRALTTPNRYTSVVKAFRHDGAKAAFMNTHYVSGAWNGKLKAFKKWRQEQWGIHWSKQAEWVQELVADGYTVIGAGDFNRNTVPKFHPHQQTLVQRGIDHMWIIPAADITVQADMAAAYTYNLYTDHPALVAHVVLHKTANIPAVRK